VPDPSHGGRKAAKRTAKRATVVHPVLVLKRGASLRVWSGSYRFGRSDSVFRAVANAGRTYVDETPEKRPPPSAFRRELEELRTLTAADAQVATRPN
jgi:hypothetical protein